MADRQPEAEQIDGVGGQQFGQHRLVEAPVVGVGPEAMNQQQGLRHWGRPIRLQPMDRSFQLQRLWLGLTPWLATPVHPGEPMAWIELGWSVCSLDPSTWSSAWRDPLAAPELLLRSGLSTGCCRARTTGAPGLLVVCWRVEPCRGKLPAPLSASREDAADLAGCSGHADQQQLLAHAPLTASQPTPFTPVAATPLPAWPNR